MKRILFPTDFSPAAEHAFNYTLRLARDLKAEIELLYVIPEQHQDMDFEQLKIVELVNQDRVEEVLRNFDEYQIRMQKSGNISVPVDVRIEKGKISSEILYLSKEFDMIAMGTQGAKSHAEKIFGSVTAKVVNQAYCPVLVIPETAEYTGVEHVMYATSLRSEDLDLIPFMQQFVDALEAKISYAHVDTQLKEGPVYSAVEEGYSWGKQINLFGYYRFSYPDVVAGLKAFVEAQNVDIVAMLHRSGDLFDRWFRKSYAEEMTLYTLVPLLVLHTDETEK
jgi:nucleotide-binding universal stress UspA family protein